MSKILEYPKLAAEITQWITDYAEKAGMTSLVIGISGGIDSAVVSTLCARTGLPTFACNIPIRSHEDHTSLAQVHMDWLVSTYGIFSHTMNLDYVLMELIRAVPFDNKHGWANTKSRLRMTALYQVAATVNGLVVGTGNKVEDYGVMFYTKYGDGGVDISPIGDLTKSQVRELARYLKIDDRIINATPTDGLWDDQRTDESQIGATYEELEWAMENGRWSGDHYMIDKDEVSERQWRVVDIYKNLNKKGQHKVQPIPVYKLTDNVYK